MHNIFSIYAYYFQKGKNATEMHKKVCAVCGEGAVTERVKSVWRSFVLEISRQMMLHGREVDSDQIETGIENNQHAIPHGRQLTYPNYPTQLSYW